MVTTAVKNTKTVTVYKQQNTAKADYMKGSSKLNFSNPSEVNLWSKGFERFTGIIGVWSKSANLMGEKQRRSLQFEEKL